MSKYTLIVGIDVSKTQIDYYKNQLDTQGKKGLFKKSKARNKKAKGKVKNEVEALHKWLGNYDINTTLFVFEATGTYSDKLIHTLAAKTAKSIRVNPLISRRFIEALGLTNSDDAIDAYALSLFPLSVPCEEFKYPSQAEQNRKRILSALEVLEKDIQAYENRIHAEQQNAEPHEAIIVFYRQFIDRLEAAKKSLMTDLDSLTDDKLKQTKKKLRTVKGIGSRSALYLSIFFGDFSSFTTSKQVLKFIGIAPGQKISGSSVYHKKGITKQGSGKLRGILFMAAKSAIRWNHACEALYKRLRKKGKCYFVAMVAVMGKLVRQSFAVVKHNKDFDNDLYLKGR